MAVADGTAGAVCPAALGGALGRLGVGHGLVEEALEALRVGTAELPEGRRVLVARGRPPVAGADGRVEFLVNAARQVQYRQEKDGSLNFRETNLVESVAAGQVLARLHPPTDGQPGRNVLDEPIPARKGQPARLKNGPGTEWKPGEVELTARVPGRPILDDGRLSVEPVLNVPGDVDYSVGNIRFSGLVVVGGSVLDGFEVHADRGLEIRGTAGSCVLRSGGDIAVAGGVNGRGKATVETGGRVRAKYLNETEVRAGGDVEVASEIVNCRVSTLGRVTVTAGAIIGGETVARCGVTVRTLGSELGVPTRLVIGRNHEVAARMEALSSRAAVIDGEIPRLIKRLENFADRRVFLALPSKEQERVKGEFARFKELKAERAQIDADLGGLAAQNRLPAEPPRLTVTGLLCPEVTVLGLQGHAENKESRPGPVVFVEDPGTGRMTMNRGTMVGAAHG